MTTTIHSPTPTRPAHFAPEILNMQEFCVRDPVVRDSGRTASRESRSYWIHDSDEEDNVARRARKKVRSKVTAFFKTRRGWIILIVIVVVALGIAGGLAGYFGSRSSSRGEDDSQEPGDVDSEDPPQEEPHAITLHESSSLASIQYLDERQMLFFQDNSQEIIVSEFRGSDTQTYPLQSRMDEGQTISNVASGSPFAAVHLNRLMHLFYMNTTRHLQHASYNPSTQRWTMQSIRFPRGQTPRRATDAMRLSAAVYPAIPEHPNGYMGLVYQLDTGGVTFNLLTSNGTGAWSRTRLNGIDDVRMQDDSPALIATPYHQASPSDDDTNMVIRMFWDQRNAGVRVEDCPLEEDGLGTCHRGQNNWQSAPDRVFLLDRPKPLRLARVDIELDGREAYILFILDGDGLLWELFWDGSQWTGYKEFSVEESDEEYVFSSIAAKDGGDLFAVMDGEILHFTRASWWWRSDEARERPGWRLEGSVKLA